MGKLIMEYKMEDINEYIYKYHTKIATTMLKMDLYFNSKLCRITGINKTYDPIVRDAAKLFLDFCPNQTVHEYFYLYRYMLKYGYFSVQPFEYRDIYDIRFNGRCIMSGYGNCRHISGLYQDILKEMSISFNSGVASSLFDVLLPDDNVESEIANLNRVEANHIVNLVRQNDEYYIQDATNNFIFSTNHLLEGKQKLCCDSILKNERILIFPGSFMAYCSLTEKDVMYHLHKMNNSGSISKKELRDVKKRMKKLCKDNLDVLDSFHERNFGNIEQIYQKVKKLGSLDLYLD